MHPLRTSRLFLTAVFLAAVPTVPAAAAELAVGATAPALEAKDQHEKEFKLGDDVVYLLVAFDMGTGKAANGRLEKKGATWLDEHHAVFVSNIHGMPGVGRMFALPKMRKYPHRIILADAQGLLDAFPQTESRVTVLKLQPGRVIEAISYWDPRKEDAPF
jgi:hypothetical protein